MKRLLVFVFILVLAGYGGSVYATEMPEEVVGANNDDGHETDAPDCQEDLNYVCMVYVSGCVYGFYRFTSIPIAQGATIDACTMFVDVYSVSYDDPNVTIHCEDTSSATTLPTTGACISVRNRTTASVTWNASGIGAGYQPSPELKTVVQEVVNRGDWSSGNSLAFVFVVNSGANFYTDSYEVSQPAKLHCWYTAAAEGGNKIMWRK